MSLLGGVVALGFGLHAIVTRRVAIGDDDGEEPHTWWYGWRAVAVGTAALLAAALFFASAAGLVHLEWT
jgi:O-antigen/teichoic acid export membrane protein